MPETLPPLDREEKEGITRFWEFGQGRIREVCADGLFNKFDIQFSPKGKSFKVFWD